VKGNLLQCTPRKAVGKGKGKVRPVTGYEGPEGGVLDSFFKLGVRWGGWLTPGSSPFKLRKETRYKFYRWLGGPQERSGRVRKISFPPRFDPRAVQPVESRRCTGSGF